MNFLGLRLCDHDSNLTLTLNEKVRYYKPERDYQIKHFGWSNLYDWVNILNKWNISLLEIDAIGIVLDCHRYPNIKTNESLLFESIDIPIFKDLGYSGPVYRFDHHYAHALSCWVLGVQSDLDFVFDGGGDKSISHSIFQNKNKLCEMYRDQFSFGSMMSYVGDIIGLSGNEYDMAGKVMALKAFGRNIDFIASQKYKIDEIENFWELDKLHFFAKNKDYQSICDHIQRCHELTENIFESYFLENTNSEDVITYSGGVALNTIINTKIKNIRGNLHIPPHVDDEGLSIGIVEGLRKEYNCEKFDKSNFPFWQEDEESVLRPDKNIIKKTSEMLSKGKIVGWYQGKGEIGPRALGNRSILMNPSIVNGKDLINLKVKHRESFRPFGASILEEKTSNFFNWDQKSPYMLYVMDIKDKNSFPPITHNDGTCRIQTVSQDQEIYYELISEFELLTGIPMLLNTSLNMGGNPTAGHFSDALDLLENSDLDSVVIGNQIYEK